MCSLFTSDEYTIVSSKTFFFMLCKIKYLCINFIVRHTLTVDTVRFDKLNQNNFLCIIYIWPVHSCEQHRTFFSNFRLPHWLPFMLLAIVYWSDVNTHKKFLKLSLSNLTVSSVCLTVKLMHRYLILLRVSLFM